MGIKILIVVTCSSGIIIAHFESSAKSCILTQERVATRAEVPCVSRPESRLAPALKYVPQVIQTIFFVRCIPKFSRVGVVLRAVKLICCLSTIFHYLS